MYINQMNSANYFKYLIRRNYVKNHGIPVDLSLTK